ncbi:MAG TPA: sigma-70 family RNA polymerase sigma factor [Planctomycetota bacterium]|nr:sigma-70 family RNA polymerase sigma factor [Planctomycetota bacterium]
MPAPERPAEPSDEELVARLVAGDRSAGDLLVRRHYKLVAKAVRDVGAEEQSVEDMVQDIFLRAFRKASRYQASLGRFTAWLATVARHDALNHLRRRRAATVSLDETLLAAGTTSEAGTEITIALMEAIGRLKEPGQTIARLRLLEGKSFAQIGRATNHPTETVKTIYYRNIEKLRKAIR